MTALPLLNHVSVYVISRRCRSSRWCCEPILFPRFPSVLPHLKSLSSRPPLTHNNRLLTRDCLPPHRALKLTQQVLDLHRNELTRLPAEIGGMAGLQVLNLELNRLVCPFAAGVAAVVEYRFTPLPADTLVHLLLPSLPLQG